MRLAVGPGAVEGGRVGVGYRFLDEDADPLPREVLVELPDSVMPHQWAEARIWDQAAGVPRLPSGTETLEQARTDKRRELEAAFRAVWSSHFDDPVFAVLAYVELKTDPRTVAVTVARNNLISKEQELSDLGRPGRPPLTQAQIDLIVW